MSYTTPKPRWWPSDLRGTDANSGDGWVGSCVAACLKELVQKWAKSLGIRTACSNTNAGPAVPFVALLLRYISTEFRRHTCSTVADHLHCSRWPKPNKVMGPNRNPMAHGTDRHSYRYVAYLAYEAYRPRPLPQILRIRVRAPQL